MLPEGGPNRGMAERTGTGCSRTSGSTTSCISTPRHTPSIHASAIVIYNKGRKKQRKSNVSIDETQWRAGHAAVRLKNPHDRENARGPRLPSSTQLLQVSLEMPSLHRGASTRLPLELRPPNPKP